MYLTMQNSNMKYGLIVFIQLPICHKRSGLWWRSTAKNPTFPDFEHQKVLLKGVILGLKSPDQNAAELSPKGFQVIYELSHFASNSDHQSL